MNKIVFWTSILLFITSCQDNGSISTQQELRIVTLLENGEYNKAEYLTDSLLVQFPTEGVLYVLRGHSSYGNNQYSNALIDYQTGVKYGYSDFNHMNNMGDSYFKLEQYDSAV